MSDLAAAAAAMGVPEAIVKRSAEARAKATGASVDEVLAAWAGGVAAPAAAPASSPKPQAPSPTPEEPDAEETPTPVEQPVAAAAGSQLTAPGPQLTAPPPAPKEVSPKEAMRFPVVVTVPTSGLTETTAPGIPTWLASMLVVIPLFGLLLLAGATTNDCGQGAELAADRVSGQLINCDGTPFEGRGEPGGQTDFIALGEQVFTGQVAPVANCQGCHGAQGQGVTAPALTTVLATFGSCADHLEWVSKGTNGFQGEGRPTYGDLGKPVGGGGIMP
ncbi:MAG: hypothetical protein ACRDWH_06850, partial [Acidimicrobiia bacterium]